jgi:hypothetical protein
LEIGTNPSRRSLDLNEISFASHSTSRLSLFTGNGNIKWYNPGSINALPLVQKNALGIKTKPFVIKKVFGF